MTEVRGDAGTGVRPRRCPVRPVRAAQAVRDLLGRGDRRRRGARRPARALGALTTVSRPRGTQRMQPYRDPALPVEERVADLLERMTLQEKAA
nr:hypothetical protein GCM10020093_113100 [Planobispora longispora]